MSAVHIHLEHINSIVVTDSVMVKGER